MPWFPYIERYEAYLADRRRVRVRQGSVDIKWQRIGRKKYPPDGEAYLRGVMKDNETRKQNKTIYAPEASECYLQHEKNTYKMLFVKVYRFVLDILLFYLAWILFRYGTLTGMSDYGFRYNYFVTIGWKVE